MGGPSKSTGSNTSDARKTSTKKYFTKKKEAKKSKFKTTKFGYKTKKNIVEQYVDKNPIYGALGNIKDKHNLNRRMRFADKKGIDITKMSTEQLLSKDFKKTLDAQGYTRKDARTGKDEGGDNRKSTEQPKVVSQMDNSEVKSKLITADKTAPTTVEMANAELTDDERMLKVKRGKKTKTVLTDLTGLKNKPTLSEKALLG